MAAVSVGYQQITSLSAATALTVPAGAQWAIIVCETQNVRWRDDGTDPTASVGMLLTTGTILQRVAKLSSVKFIEVTSGAKLNITYYRN